MNIFGMSMTPQALQDLLDELEASRASRKRSWEILQEIRWVLKDTAGIEAQQPARKTIDLEGRLVKDAVRKTLRDRQNALTQLLQSIREYRKFADQPLTLRGSEYAHAVRELNQAIDRAEELLQ
jgi:exonuclease V gamma subunit